MDAAQLEELIRTVTEEVARALSTHQTTAREPVRGETDSSPSTTCDGASRTSSFEGRLLTEKQLAELGLQGHRRILLRADTLVTPLACDRARENGIELVRDKVKFVTTCTAGAPSASRKLVLLAPSITESEREKVLQAAASCGFGVEIEVPAGRTAGAVREAALKCASQVLKGLVERAVIVDENAYSLVAALAKEPGIKASTCWNIDSAVAARKDCGGNALVLSNRQLGLTMLGRIVCAWLSE